MPGGLTIKVSSALSNRSRQQFYSFLPHWGIGCSTCMRKQHRCGRGLWRPIFKPPSMDWEGSNQGSRRGNPEHDGAKHERPEQTGRCWDEEALQHPPGKEGPQPLIPRVNRTTKKTFCATLPELLERVDSMRNFNAGSCCTLGQCAIRQTSEIRWKWAP